MADSFRRPASMVADDAVSVGGPGPKRTKKLSSSMLWNAYNHYMVEANKMDSMVRTLTTNFAEAQSIFETRPAPHPELFSKLKDFMDDRKKLFDFITSFGEMRSDGMPIPASEFFAADAGAQRLLDDLHANNSCRVGDFKAHISEVLGLMGGTKYDDWCGLMSCRKAGIFAILEDGLRLCEVIRKAALHHPLDAPEAAE